MLISASLETIAAFFEKLCRCRHNYLPPRLNSSILCSIQTLNSVRSVFCTSFTGIFSANCVAKSFIPNLSSLGLSPLMVYAPFLKIIAGETVSMELMRET
jgi:hypothetical protein